MTEKRTIHDDSGWIAVVDHCRRYGLGCLSQSEFNWLCVIFERFLQGARPIAEEKDFLVATPTLVREVTA